MLYELSSNHKGDLEREKLLFLGLFLKEKASFKLCKLIEGEEPLQILSKFSHSEKELLRLAKVEIGECQKGGIKLLYYREKDYPEVLQSIPYKPPFLYVKGRIPQGLKLAIVGTRRPSPYGKEILEYFVPPLVEANLVTLSGLARGIDTLVHQETLKQGGQTLAILGTGLDVIYPPENKGLFAKILNQGSGIISEFPLGTLPKKENFPRRNRLISGFSMGVLVIEAGIRSGTLITAKWAQEQGRDVFVVPGNIFSDQSQGTHFLLKNGAIPVTSPGDVLYYLGIEAKPTDKTESTWEETELSPAEKEILKLLSKYPVHLENLLQASNLDLPQLLSHLTELELKGLVKGLPGKFYQKA